MTERTCSDVDKDMDAVHQRILDRRFVYGPSHASAVVSFNLGYNDEDKEGFRKFDEGLTKGLITPVVTPLDEEFGVRLTSELMKKIHTTTMEILRDEAEELRKLRAEMNYVSRTNNESSIFGCYAAEPSIRF